MFQKLLVPIDGSSFSTHAVEKAAALAECCHASVYLVHVIRDLSLPKEILDMMAAGEVTASRMQILQDSAEIILQNARKKLEAAGITDVQMVVLLGDPTLQILQAGTEYDADLIVLGQRGLGPHGDLLGGVARKILHRTTIPCLVVT